MTGIRYQNKIVVLLKLNIFGTCILKIINAREGGLGVKSKGVQGIFILIRI